MKRTHYYSIGSMLTDEEVHQVWEIVGNALDRNGFVDASVDYQDSEILEEWEDLFDVHTVLETVDNWS